VRFLQLDKIPKSEFQRLLRRAQTDITAVLPQVSEIVNSIRDRGDEALVGFVRDFEFAAASASDLRVPEATITAAGEKLDPEVKDALDLAFRQIWKYHEQQKPEGLRLTELGAGILAGEKTTPIPSVCIYVPRGKGAFPSVVLMLGVPAAIAGVKRIVMVTPPDKAGELDSASLYAAELCGIREIYKMGGAHAVAALGLGTETIDPVVKILGPGGAHATAAKRLLYGQVDVGVPAGPSEAIIFADSSADPKLVALDLLIEAEHGPDSAALLVTHDEAVARRTSEEVGQLLALLPQRRREFAETVFNTYGGIVITSSEQESFDFVNEYAPEHLQLHVSDPFAALNRVTDAGEILLGSSTPISLANYVIGVNAILPTGRFARSYSPVSVRDYMKTSGIAHVTPAGFAELGKAAIVLANYEGFPAHALALQKRLEFAEFQQIKIT
jgi:histidinol dehydrogenase